MRIGEKSVMELEKNGGEATPFLRRLLPYEKICIQCHNNPDSDTVASAFGVYKYLTMHGVRADVVYSGPQKIKKTSMKMMVSECHIPIRHVESIEGYDLLLLVDCQYGQNNVERLEAPEIALIDHHIPVVEIRDNYLIKSNYQSCSTIVRELLREENYPLEEDEDLQVALLYGLYVDTSAFADLLAPVDIAMKDELFHDQPLFDRLAKASMSVAELPIASDAMLNHYFDVERRFAIVEALTCDQSVLGIIGDFMIQVDVVHLSFTYTENCAGYQVSLRSCHESLPANEIAAFVCDGIGGGGGHKKKAGGRILREQMERKYPGASIFDVVKLRLSQYADERESS